MNVLVSVVMSVHNGEKYLEESIKSIIRQTYKNFEFIIIDDHSSDSSVTIMESFNDDRIKIIKNSKNIGLPSSLNKGIREASGEYVVRQDDDDISHINRIEMQLRYALSSDLDAVFCRYCYIDRKGSTTNNCSKFFFENNILSSLVNKKDPLAHGSAIIKRSALLKINGYNEKFIYGQDYELWIRMLTLNYRIAMIDDVCYFQRIKFDYNKRQWQKMYAELVDKALYSDINIETDIDKIYNNIINTKSRITIKASIINFWNLVKFKINTCLMNLKQ